MPTLTRTIEDTSPIIVYSASNGEPHWKAGSSKNDPSIEAYSQSSFMVTNITRATVSFEFYGTGVQLFGSKRQNHGLYQISIDALTYPQVNGAVNDTQGTFQTPLFQTVALANGAHKVTMQNMGTGDLDIDFITWQTPIGQAEEQLITTVHQDSDSNFKYEPSNQWTISPANVGMFSAGSGHVTSTAGSFVEYKFKVVSPTVTRRPFSSVAPTDETDARGQIFFTLSGDAVSIFGPVGPASAPYSVSLDGADATNFTANKPFYRPQMMLYHASNLGGGEHTVRLTSEAWNNSALALAIDYAQVFSTSSLQGSAGSGRLATGTILAITAGALLGVVILSAMVVFCIRGKSKYGRYFRLKGKNSDRGSNLITEPLSHQPSFTTSLSSYHDHTPTHALHSAGSVSLHSRPSHGTLHALPMGVTPPSTGMYTSPAGTGGLYHSISADSGTLGPNTQVITIPFTPDGKYRPDLTNAPPPALMPPPAGMRRDISQTSTDSYNTSGHAQPMMELRPNRREVDHNLSALPPGARQPVPNVSDEERRIAGSDDSHYLSPGPSFSPMRRGDPVNNPPGYAI